MPALQEFLCRSKWMLIYMKKRKQRRGVIVYTLPVSFILDFVHGFQ